MFKMREGLVESRPGENDPGKKCEGRVVEGLKPQRALSSMNNA
jgi:hypothetical protein